MSLIASLQSLTLTPILTLTLNQVCLIASLQGLTEAQAREADRWVELYEHHDKYHLVGLLRECATMLPTHPHRSPTRPPALPPARLPPATRRLPPT